MYILVNDQRNIRERGGSGLVGIIICWESVRRRRRGGVVLVIMVWDDLRGMVQRVF